VGSLWRRIYSEIGGGATQRRLQPRPERIRYRGHLKMTDSDCAEGIREEARQTLMNIGTTLEAYGLRLGDVAERSIMLAETGEWQMFNGVCKGFFEPPYPARSPLGINGLALGGGRGSNWSAWRYLPAERCPAYWSPAKSRMLRPASRGRRKVLRPQLPPMHCPGDGMADLHVPRPALQGAMPA